MFKLQSRFFLLVKWVFHYLGFIIERVPSESQLYYDLNNNHEAVQKFVLKRLTNNIRIANNHRRYDSLLKKYVPKWDCNHTSATFMGDGIGEFSFDTFRKVRFQGSDYFEKVYFNNSYDLLKIEWFHEHMNSFLAGSINVAKINKIIKGDLITIVYFEFTDLIPISSERLDVVSFEISRKLIEISNRRLVMETAQTAPDFLKDYRHHAFYRGNIERASMLINKLSQNKLSKYMIERVVERQPLVLTHGDIRETNVFQHDYLIDWDSFGFFPCGFESAYILFQADYRVGQGSLSLLDLQEIILENYSGIISREAWSGFELCTFYFYFIFTAADASIAPSMLQEDLLTRIEQLCLEANLEIQELKSS